MFIKNRIASGYLFMVLAALGFSVKSILVKIAFNYGISPMTLLLMRLFMAVPFFMIALLIVEKGEAFNDN